MPYLEVVKKTFRYLNSFFYNHLCRNSLILNIFMESGIKKSEGNVKLKCIQSESDGYCAKAGKSHAALKDLFGLKNDHFYNINKLRI